MKTLHEVGPVISERLIMISLGLVSVGVNHVRQNGNEVEYKFGLYDAFWATLSEGGQQRYIHTGRLRENEPRRREAIARIERDRIR